MGRSGGNVKLMAHSRTVVHALPTISGKAHALPKGEEFCSAHLIYKIDTKHTCQNNGVLNGHACSVLNTQRAC